MENADLLNILKTGNTVFTFKEILLMSGETNPALLRRRISYYLKQGLIYPVRRGIYSKDKGYDKYELASKIITPSYISFETVLAAAGLIFQHDSRIHVASYQSREISCGGQVYAFHKIKDDILVNQAGVLNEKNYSIATKERAFLDVLYLNRDFYFDNLSVLDWDKVNELLEIYKNIRLAKTVRQLRQAKKD